MSPRGLVACAFHWYAVSACNYVSLTGWLAHGEAISDRVRKQKVKKYVQEVLGAVEAWRNKVGAHFALVYPFDEDSPADRASSVSFPIAFVDGSFSAHAVRLKDRAKYRDNPVASDDSSIAPWRKRLLSLPLETRPPKKTDDTQGDWQWSLTEVHRDLASPYWPERMAGPTGG